MTPQKNLYRPTLKALWGKLVDINGMLFLIANQIENYEKQQERLWKKKGIKSGSASVRREKFIRIFGLIYGVEEL